LRIRASCICSCISHISHLCISELFMYINLVDLFQGLVSLTSHVGLFIQLPFEFFICRI